MGNKGACHNHHHHHRHHHHRAWALRNSIKYSHFHLCILLYASTDMLLPLNYLHLTVNMCVLFFIIFHIISCLKSNGTAFRIKSNISGIVRRCANCKSWNCRHRNTVSETKIEKKLHTKCNAYSCIWQRNINSIFGCTFWLHFNLGFCSYCVCSHHLFVCYYCYCYHSNSKYFFCCLH